VAQRPTRQVKKPSTSNVTDDTTQNLQIFTLLDLQQYTQEKIYTQDASQDFHLFFVGRDDVHHVLKHVLSRVRLSLYLNMFGYDDDELNEILMAKVKDPNVTMLITLDKSQAGGKHEKMLLDADRHRRWRSSTHISSSASRRRTRSATPRVSPPTARWAPKDRPTGRRPVRAPSCCRTRPADQVSRRRTTPRRSSPIPIRYAASRLS
jgi:hypothetical protein